MFASIRKHQKWLWAVISAAVIVSFVIFFTPDVESHFKGGGRGGEENFGTVYGQPIKRDDVQAAHMEARLRFFLFSGSRGWPEDDPNNRRFFNQDRETATRLFLMKTIEQMDIRVSEEAAADWIVNAFRDSNGAFRKESFDQFVTTALRPKGYSYADVVEFARHEVALQHLVALTGQAGTLVSPMEAGHLFKEANESITAEAAFFSASNHLASVALNPAAIGQYFTNQMATYRIPERKQISYIRLDPSKFFPEADKRMATETNLTQLIDSVYLQRGTNAFVDATNQPLTPAAAKEQIRSEVRLSHAIRAGQSVANTLTEQVMEMVEKQPGQTDALDKVAAANGHPVLVTAPFADFELNDASLPPDFERVAAGLTLESPIAEPVLSTNGVYVLALKRIIPSEVPSFESVRAKVTEDYRNSQALEAARTAGNNFQAALVSGLDSGKTFEAIATGAKVTPIRFPAFSQSTKSVPEIEAHASLLQVKSAADSVAAGKASRFIATRDGGFVLFVRSRQAVDASKMTAELQEFTTKLRQERIYQAFNEWFRREQERTGFRFATGDTKEN